MGSDYRIVTDPGLVKAGMWDAFTEKHRWGNIFNSSWMVSLYETTDKVKPITLFCTDNEGSVVGLLIAYLMKEGKGILSFLTSRAVIWGGPLALDDDPVICSLLLEELKKQLKGEVIYIQVRNLNDTSIFKGVFKDLGFRFEEHLNILFNLGESDKTLWKGMHPTRRKQVNRAVKRGVTTSVVLEPSGGEISNCYKILSDIYRRARLPLPALSLFIKAGEMNSKEKRLGIITAICENRLIGFRFFLIYNGLIYDWYAGSNDKYYDRYPNDILPWALIEWGCRNGYHTFDFGGAGSPDERYGVRDYKLKFGGKVVNFGRYLFVFRPLIYFTAKALVNTRKKLSR
jgi:serine/alanine adding enzyme